MALTSLVLGLIAAAVTARTWKLKFSIDVTQLYVKPHALDQLRDWLT